MTTEYKRVVTSDEYFTQVFIYTLSGSFRAMVYIDKSDASLRAINCGLPPHRFIYEVRLAQDNYLTPDRIKSENINFNEDII